MANTVARRLVFFSIASGTTTYSFITVLYCTLSLVLCLTRNASRSSFGRRSASSPVSSMKLNMCPFSEV